MNTIESQIEALTQELRPYPKFENTPPESMQIWTFNGDLVTRISESPMTNEWAWIHQFASTNKAEVEEYADCYKRLKLYQLIGKKAEKEFPLTREGEITLKKLHGTDFIGAIYPEGAVITRRRINRPCVLGGVWFSREEDRLEALKICKIDKAFQEKCSKFGLGGA